MPNRANRRHHLERMKQRAKQKCKNWDIPDTDKVIGRMARTPTACSCSMCGNARRNRWQPAPVRQTMQERRHIDDIDLGIQELTEK